MNAWGWARLPGPDFGVGGEILDRPAELDLLAAIACTDTLDTLSRLITPAGHRLRLATNAEEVLQEYEADRPDVVLLDESLGPPEENGLPLRLKEVTATQCWVPVVLMSGAPPEPGLCQRTGIDDWLPKPLEPNALTLRLDLLGRSLALQHRLLEMHRFQALFDHVLDGIVATDASGIVESFNPAAEKIFGYRAEEIVGRSVNVLMPLPDAHRHDAYMARYRATGEPTVMGRGRDIFGKRKDGTLVPLHITLSQMEWLGRRHFVAVIEDISERKRQEQRLTNTLSELERYRERAEAERQATREIVARISQQQAKDPLLRWTVLPAQTFSGDLLLAQRGADGRLYVFAADALGQGLPAAVSLLPVAGLFHALAAKATPLAAIAAEMNHMLAELFPTNPAVAVCLLAVDEGNRQLEVWNGGLPPPLFCQAGEAPRLLGKSRAPRGGASTATTDGVERLAWSQPGRVLIYSDSLRAVGALRAAGLDAQTLCAVLAEGSDEDPLAPLLARLHAYLGEQAPEDDILLAVLKLP